MITIECILHDIQGALPGLKIFNSEGQLSALAVRYGPVHDEERRTSVVGYKLCVVQSRHNITTR
jgi:hypothetical protein